MSHHPREYAKVAREYRVDGDLVSAGGYYTAAGHAWFSHIWPLEEDATEFEGMILPRSIGYSVESFLAGALCYRLAGEMNRCRTRCEQGILLVKDVKDNEPGWFEGMGLDEGRSNARLGLAHELIGDFRLYGDLGDYEKQYATAKREYETVRAEYPAETPEIAWQAETEFASPMSLLTELAKSVDYDLDEETAERICNVSLLDRIEYKKNHYDAIIEEVLAEGNWVSDTL